MNEPCEGILGRLFGHAYEAFFDEEPAHPDPLGDVGRATPSVVENILAANTRYTYRGHACRRCGRVANQQPRAV